MGAQGTATLDFGAWPGTDLASVAIAEAGVGAGSVVEAWLQPADTADHSADEHRAEDLEILAGKVQAGVGFTIYGRAARGDRGRPASVRTIDGYATAAASVAGSGVDWTNPSNAVGAPDGGIANADSAAPPPADTDSLDLDFSALVVPAGAIVTGIGFIIVRAWLNGATSVLDTAVQVRKNGTEQTVVDLARTAGLWPTSLTPAQYGGPGQTWGVSWAPGDTIGLRLKANVRGIGARAAIDSVYGFVQYRRRPGGRPHGAWNVGWVWE